MEYYLRGYDSFILAAGDDVVAWVDKDKSKEAMESILSLTAREPVGTVGLGQCVSEIRVSKFDDFDF